MVRIYNAVLGLLALVSTSNASPLTDSKFLAKRDFAGDVCGTPSGGSTTVASDTRTSDLWNGHDMVDWFANALKPYIVMDWKYPGNTVQPNIQSIILTLMGNDGSEQCAEILDPICTGTGLDWNLCKQHPEATFVWFATTHFAHFLYQLQSTLSTSTLSITSLTHDLVTKFFTPQKDPSQLIVPVSIASGVAAGISSVFPPAAVAAGVGSIVNGIVTQIGLDKEDPLEQWGEVQDAVGAAFTQLTKGLEQFFNNVLKGPLPDTKDNELLYSADPNQLPVFLQYGAFASEPAVGSLNNGVYGGISAAAINALWSADMVFLMLLTDDVWGKGAGQACQALPSQTTCIDGVAHILMRWMHASAKAPVTPGSFAVPDSLDPSQWAVWGASKAGDPINGVSNDDHLGDFMLDIVGIIKSIKKTFAANGYPFKNQNGATIESLKNNPKDLDQADLLFFSLPVCDLGAIMQGYHFNFDTGTQGEGPIEAYAGCTCLMTAKWPTAQGYTLGDNALGSTQCKKQGWVKD